MLMTWSIWMWQVDYAVSKPGPKTLSVNGGTNEGILLILKLSGVSFVLYSTLSQPVWRIVLSAAKSVLLKSCTGPIWRVVQIFGIFLIAYVVDAIDWVSVCHLSYSCPAFALRYSTAGFNVDSIGRNWAMPRLSHERALNIPVLERHWCGCLPCGWWARSEGHATNRSSVITVVLSKWGSLT